MNSAVGCPNTETIEDLRANRLPSAEAAELRRHLQECPTCSQQLRAGSHPSNKRYAFLSPPTQDGDLGFLDPFRILGVLGEGGMAIVFDAEDPTLHRRVALKVLNPKLSDVSIRERFLREARLLASVSNEYVVTIYQVGESNNIPYLVMEHLTGMTLEERLKADHWLPLGEALAIARQAAEGLQVAHQHGLIHRDVKPANLWLTRKEGQPTRVKLIDFGIARKLGEASDLTLRGQILGTPVYMAPEQALGESVDARTDLYSLGCVLFHMLTGKPPISREGNTQALLREIIKGRTSLVRKETSHMPPAVADLILQLLQREPENRPASAAIVVEHLQQIEDQTRSAILPAVPSHIPPEIQRKRSDGRLGIILGILMLILALLVGIAAGSYKIWSAMNAAQDDQNQSSPDGSQ